MNTITYQEKRLNKYICILLCENANLYTLLYN